MGSLVRLAIYTRWGRFLLGALFLAGAIFGGMSAFANTDIKTKTGTLVDGSDIVDKNSGAYQYSELKLSGDSATYRIDVKAFTPTLSGDNFVKDGTVDLWYTTPLSGQPNIVAIQLRDDQNQNPTKYVSAIYTNPSGERTSSLIGAGVIALFAVAAVLAGLFLPTSFGRKKPQAAVAARPAGSAQPPAAPR